MTVTILQGDCRELLRTLPAASFHACVCDPPYHLTSGKQGGSGPASASSKTPAGRARIGTGFMGQAWDGGDVAYQVDTWAEVFRVLKPGAYLLAFGGTRTYHRMACAIEDAGFEIRDCIRSEQGQETWPGWVYASGFPKSLDAAKAIDRHLGRKGDCAPTGPAVRRIVPGADQNATGAWEKLEDRTYQPHAYAPATAEADEWQGWGTALKPAWEPIVVARKPLDGTVAANLLEHGCGALNIDACRIATDDALGGGAYAKNPTDREQIWGAEAGNSWRRGGGGDFVQPEGRWPANLVHDGSAEVEAAFAAFGTRTSGRPGIRQKGNDGVCFGAESRPPGTPMSGFGDSGSAARFFYNSKAGKHDRAGSKHPTVKPVALMRYLVRLVTPPGGRVLDPFAGSGTTGEAAHLEGFDATLCELLQAHVADIRRRLARVECNITSDAGGADGGPGVNITPPKAVHNKHYVALEGST